MFDLGGGTFDVGHQAAVRQRVIEVRATQAMLAKGDGFDRGDLHGVVCGRTDLAPAAGGNDQDQRNSSMAARCAAPQTMTMSSLTDETVMELELGKPDTDGRTARAVLNARLFAQIARPLFDRLRQPLARALADSRIRSEELSDVVLVGGATRMPSVRRLAATLLGRIPLQTIDPDQVVALGAAVQAGLKMREADLRDVVLTDVAPYTLGMEVVESLGEAGMSAGRLLPVIERNTVVPVSRTRTVVPVQDFQRRVVVRIYQGESRLVKDNIWLGDLTLDLKPRRRDEQTIEDAIKHDVNGLLEKVCR